MVVSGLPNRIGKKHAGEIAKVSLDLLSAMTTFKVRHKPDYQLQLRIGIHSGKTLAKNSQIFSLLTMSMLSII